jgi:hypothetical protein
MVTAHHHVIIIINVCEAMSLWPPLSVITMMDYDDGFNA